MDGPRIEVMAMQDDDGAFVMLKIDHVSAKMVPDAARVLSLYR